MPGPRIFISHCNDHIEPTIFAARVIGLLGCVPVIAEEQASLGLSLPFLVFGTMESCDAVLVIVTADSLRDGSYEPSGSVIAELTKIQDSEKFRNRWFVIREEGVRLTPLIAATYTSFTMSNFGPIAQKILIELSAMKLYSNYYSSPASDFSLHELGVVLSEFKDLKDRGFLTAEAVVSALKDQLDKLLVAWMKGGAQ